MYIAYRSQHVDARIGFFQCFARGGLGGGFAVFHESGGQCPQSVARFDGAAAEQDAPVLPFRDGADDQLGILVMDGGADGADMALAMIVLRQ